MTTATRRGLLVAVCAVVLFAAAFVAGKSTAGADEVAANSGATSIELQAEPVEPIELKSAGPVPKLRPAPEEDTAVPVGPAEPDQPAEPTPPADPTPTPPQDPPPDNGGDDFF